MTEAARELRFVFVVDDVDLALRLFTEGFGLRLRDRLVHEDGRGFILDVPTATMELFDRAYADHVDVIEAGRRLGERVRIAVRVDSLDEAGRSAADAGCLPEADTVNTPWGDVNRRWRIPGAMQLTLFTSP